MRENQIRLLRRIGFSLRKRGHSAPFFQGDVTLQAGERTLSLEDTQATIRWSVRPSEDTLQVFLSLCVTKGILENSTLQGVLELDWAKENFLLMPGAVYNGNRYPVYSCEYPPFLPYNPGDKPVITDVPRLEIGEGLSRIELAAGDMTTPAAGFFAPSARRGFFVTSPHRCGAGYYGYTAEENGPRDRLTLSLSAPVLRDKMYAMCHSDLTSDDEGFTLSAGQQLEMTFRLQEFDCASIGDLFSRFTLLRKTFGQIRTDCHLPFSEAFRLVEDKFNRESWHPEEHFYTLTQWDAVGYGCWQPGWVGGGMIQLAFLADGQPLSVQRSLEMLDFILGKAQTPAGFFYTVYTPGVGYWGDDFLDKTNSEVLLIRKQTDILYFLLLQLEYIKKEMPAESRLPRWETKVRQACNALARLWKKNGRWGQFVNWKTETIQIDGTLSGVSGCAALALGARYFNDPSLMDIAKASGEFYYRNFISEGITNGGPGEILQCPDSESAFGALEAFVTLFEETGEPRWLEYALSAARLAASWVVSYDFTFPAASTFGELGMPTAGCVWANVQNKHAAPGICTFSGDSLFRLYRYTRDPFCMELCREIAHAIPWFVSRPDRIIRSSDGKELGSGWINERVNLSDWEGKSCVGEVFYGPCWPESSMALTYTQLPGIYVDLASRKLWVLDHVEAELIENPDGILLKIANPTAFDARVKLCIETGGGQLRQEIISIRSLGKFTLDCS